MKHNYYCRRCWLRDGSRTKDLELLQVRRCPRGIEATLSCRRCGWRWSTVAIDGTFPGFTEALAELDRPRLELAIIEPANQIDDTGPLTELQKAFMAVEALTSSQKTVLLLALSASVGRELASKDRYS